MVRRVVESQKTPCYVPRGRHIGPDGYRGLTCPAHEGEVHIAGMNIALEYHRADEGIDADRTLIPHGRSSSMVSLSALDVVG